MRIKRIAITNDIRTAASLVYNGQEVNYIPEFPYELAFKITVGNSEFMLIEVNGGWGFEGNVYRDFMTALEACIKKGAKS